MIDKSIIIVVTDDQECHKLLTDAGILDKMMPKPPQNTVWACFTFRGHACLAANSVGFGDSINNGCVILMIPLKDNDPIEVADFFASVYKGLPHSNTTAPEWHLRAEPVMN